MKGRSVRRPRRMQVVNDLDAVTVMHAAFRDISMFAQQPDIAKIHEYLEIIQTEANKVSGLNNGIRMVTGNAGVPWQSLKVITRLSKLPADRLVNFINSGYWNQLTDAFGEIRSILGTYKKNLSDLEKSAKDTNNQADDLLKRIAKGKKSSPEERRILVNDIKTFTGLDYPLPYDLEAGKALNKSELGKQGFRCYREGDSLIVASMNKMHKAKFSVPRNLGEKILMNGVPQEGAVKLFHSDPKVAHAQQALQGLQEGGNVDMAFFIKLFRSKRIQVNAEIVAEEGRKFSVNHIPIDRAKLALDHQVHLASKSSIAEIIDRLKEVQKLDLRTSQGREEVVALLFQASRLQEMLPDGVKSLLEVSGKTCPWSNLGVAFAHRMDTEVHDRNIGYLIENTRLLPMLVEEELPLQIERLTKIQKMRPILWNRLVNPNQETEAMKAGFFEREYQFPRVQEFVNAFVMANDHQSFVDPTELARFEAGKRFAQLSRESSRGKVFTTSVAKVSDRMVKEAAGEQKKLQAQLKEERKKYKNRKEFDSNTTGLRRDIEGTLRDISKYKGVLSRNSEEVRHQRSELASEKAHMQALVLLPFSKRLFLMEQLADGIARDISEEYQSIHGSNGGAPIQVLDAIANRPVSPAVLGKLIKYTELARTMPYFEDVGHIEDAYSQIVGAAAAQTNIRITSPSDQSGSAAIAGDQVSGFLAATKKFPALHFAFMQGREARSWVGHLSSTPNYGDEQVLRYLRNVLIPERLLIKDARKFLVKQGYSSPAEDGVAAHQREWFEKEQQKDSRGSWQGDWAGKINPGGQASAASAVLSCASEAGGEVETVKESIGKVR